MKFDGNKPLFNDKQISSIMSFQKQASTVANRVGISDVSLQEQTQSNDNSSTIADNLNKQTDKNLKSSQISLLDLADNQGKKKADSFIGESAGTRANFEKNSDMYLRNANYSEQQKNQTTDAKITAQGGIKSAVATDTAESTMKATQQKASVVGQIEGAAIQSGMGKKAAEELAKGITDGAKDASELLKNGITQALSNTSQSMSNAKTQSDMATVQMANEKGANYGGFVGMNVAQAENQMIKSIQGMKSADAAATFMGTMGNSSFLNEDGTIKQGKDALFAVTEAQGSGINGIVTDDGKRAYSLRTNKDGTKANVSKLELGTQMDIPAVAFGAIRDGANFAEETINGDNSSDWGTNAVIATGAVLAGAWADKALGNPFKKGIKKVGQAFSPLNPLKNSGNANTNNVAKNTTQNTVSGSIETPLHSNFNSMGGLGGTPNKPTFVESVSKNLGKIKGSVSNFTGGVGESLATKVGKEGARKIPGIGAVLSVGDAAKDLARGDYVGAALDLASGVASTVPGIGTVASLGIDAANGMRDTSNINTSKNHTTAAAIIGGGVAAYGAYEMLKDGLPQTNNPFIPKQIKVE